MQVLALQFSGAFLALGFARALWRFPRARRRSKRASSRSA
jgi:hypothetical protein